MVVIDELSSFKNPQAKRFRALRKVMPRVSRVVGLTGTPSPNGLMDLWAEIYLLDRGERLERTLGAYREKYFKPGARSGYVVFKWLPVKGAEKRIRDRISDICVSMSAADYLTLPERIDNVIPVSLSKKELTTYRKMEEEQLLELGDDDMIVALNAAAVMTKLLQIANGSVYTASGAVERIHDAKLEALEEIIDTTDSPVLVFYSFRHDLDVIRERLPEARTLEGPEDIAKWQAKIAAVKQSGFVHGKYEGNEQQLPAFFVTDNTGKVLYAHYAANSIDMPTVDEALEIVKKL
jgi:SNF2 family DNA or RNA helicase